MDPRIEGVTNTSRGLLPQLVDVLNALADSQEVLRARVGKAIHELLIASASGGDELRQAMTSNVGGPGISRRNAVNRTLGREHRYPFSSDTGEWAKIRTTVFGADRTSDPTTKARVISNDSQVETPNISTRIATPGDDFNAHGQITPTPQSPKPTGLDMKEIDTGTNSYNFFDDLDSRLAELRGSESNGDEAGP